MSILQYVNRHRVTISTGNYPGQAEPDWWWVSSLEHGRETQYLHHDGTWCSYCRQPGDATGTAGAFASYSSALAHLAQAHLGAVGWTLQAPGEGVPEPCDQELHVAIAGLLGSLRGLMPTLPPAIREHLEQNVRDVERLLTT